MKIRGILATLGLGISILLLGCAASGTVDVWGSGQVWDGRFVSFPSTLGMTTGAIIKKIGTPKQVVLGECRVPLTIEGGKINVVGDAWRYLYIVESHLPPKFKAELDICVIEGHSALEERYTTGENASGNKYMIIQRESNRFLLQKLYDARREGGDKTPLIIDPLYLGLQRNM